MFTRCLRLGLLSAAITLVSAGSALAQDPPTVPTAPEPPDPAVIAAEVQEVVADVQAEPANAQAIVQEYLDEKVAQLSSDGLSTALGLTKTVADLTGPVCPAVGQVSAAMPAAANVNFPASGPGATVSKTTSDTLLQTYTTAFNTLVGPAPVPPAVGDALPPEVGGVVATGGALSQVVIALLKTNWRTTYYPPNGGAPVVRDTPAFLNLPMVLDVDGDVGYELCAMMTYDLATGQIGQKIARIPLSRRTLPVDVKASALFGLVTTGYETKGSEAPYVFDAALTANASQLDAKLTKPGPSIVQLLSLLGGVLEYRATSNGPPASYTTAVSHPGRIATQPTSQRARGFKLGYTASGAGGSVDYAVKLLGGLLGGRVASTPSPTAFGWCQSSKGYCSNEPGADPELLTTSASMLASQPVKFDQFSANGTSTACSAFSTASSDTFPSGSSHFTAQRLTWAARPVAGGEAWLDTDGNPVAGCIAASNTTGSTTSLVAQDRKATWGLGNPAPLLTRTGTATCAAGTTLRAGGTLGTTFNLATYLC
jgi:hypothetical protein